MEGNHCCMMRLGHVVQGLASLAMHHASSYQYVPMIVLLHLVLKCFYKAKHSFLLVTMWVSKIRPIESVSPRRVQISEHFYTCSIKI